MLDGEELRRIVDFAVSVVVVAHRAVEQVIAENPVEGLGLRSCCAPGVGCHAHAVFGTCPASPYQSAIYLDQARVTGLDWAKLSVIADVRNLVADPAEHLDQQFVVLRRVLPFIDDQVDHVASSRHTSYTTATGVPKSRRSEISACGRSVGKIARATAGETRLVSNREFRASSGTRASTEGGGTAY